MQPQSAGNAVHSLDARGRQPDLLILSRRCLTGRSCPPAELLAFRLVDDGGAAHSANVPAAGQPAALACSSDDVAHLVGVRGWMGLDSLAAARRLGVPALFAVAPGDRYVSVATMRQLYRATPVRAKRLVVLAEGAGHGWELLGGAAGSDWSPLAVTVAAWIQGRHR